TRSPTSRPGAPRRRPRTAARWTCASPTTRAPWWTGSTRHGSTTAASSSTPVPTRTPRSRSWTPSTPATACRWWRSTSPTSTGARRSGTTRTSRCAPTGSSPAAACRGTCSRWSGSRPWPVPPAPTPDRPGGPGLALRGPASATRSRPAAAGGPRPGRRPRAGAAAEGGDEDRRPDRRGAEAPSGVSPVDCAGAHTGSAHGARKRAKPSHGVCSPAPRAPLRQVRALRAQGGVVAVAGVDPGLVRQYVEDLGLDVVDQAGERLRILVGVADTAREQAVAGEDVRMPVRVVVDEGDGARRVPDQVPCGEFDLPDPEGVAVVDQHVGRYGDALGVVTAGVGAGAGGGHHLGERLPVVPVPVGGDDGGDAVVADRAEQRAGVVGRVDQQLLVGGPATQQIGVVVHGADRDLGDHQVLEFVHVGWAADRHPTAVRHGRQPIAHGPRGRPRTSSGSARAGRMRAQRVTAGGAPGARRP